MNEKKGTRIREWLALAAGHPIKKGRAKKVEKEKRKNARGSNLETTICGYELSHAGFTGARRKHHSRTKLNQKEVSRYKSLITAYSAVNCI